MQSREEELWNAISHGVGVVFGLFALVLTVVFAADHHHPMAVVACAIYGTTLVILYLASTLYHATHQPELKKILKVVDHSSIYLLIAGTYTPFTLVTLHGAWGWSLFGIIWGLALVGLIFKLYFTGRYAIVSVIMYLLMGWMVVIAIHPLLRALPTPGLMWLLVGGLFYTGGVVFYVTDHKYKYGHFIWHLFVLAGSVAQFVAVLRYVVLYP